MDDAIERLLDGFAAFRAEHFDDEPALMRELATGGQRPAVMVIACSDSRTDPAILTRARPGELFIVRNVGAIVPPYDPSRSPQGTSSAIEFGVRGLNVRHIVVLGHAHCGGMRFLAERATDSDGEPAPSFEFLSGWVRIAQDALARAGDAAPASGTRARAIEQAGVALGVRNLASFPWIGQRVEAGELRLHGWYFDLVAGELLALDVDGEHFAPARDVLAASTA